MRSLLPLLPLLLASSGLAPARAQDWTTIPLGTSADLRAIEKTSFSQRYVVGDGGFVAQSTGGDQTVWNPVNAGTGADLLAVHQPAFGQAWVSGEAGTVRRLINGTWESRNLPTAAEDFVIFTRSSGQSYAGGSGGSLYRTTDGGSNWHLQASAGAAIRDGSGFTGSLAIAVGDNGTILKTLDGGDNWVVKPSGTSADLLAYRDVAGGILVAGTGGTMLRSTDSGETWAPVALPTSATIHDIDTSGQTASWVLAAGTGGTLLRSVDAGLTWCHLDTETTADLFAVDMVLNSLYVVAGAGGLLRQSATSGGGCFDPTAIGDPAVAAAFRLDGPWPQPVRDSGRFELTVSRGQTVRADVLDVTGRRVANLLDERIGAGGRRTIGFVPEGWPSGVYFLRVEGEDFARTKRVVVVR
jgi:photosystem II stability/assembly factor-like uncharacterized protein